MSAGSRFGDRVAYATAGQQSREAMDRLQEAASAEEVTFMGFRIGAHVISQIGSYSKLNEVMLQKKIAEAVGATVSTVCRWLKKLHSLGIIGWFGNTKGDSWAALAVHHLPVTSPAAAPIEDPIAPQDARDLLLPTRNTEREVFDEKTTKERESVPAPPLPAMPEMGTDEIVDDPVGVTGTLSPEEIHDEDARFAASRLAVHLFGRTPDAWTCQSMYRRFRALPTGASTHVLNAALLGRPARTIDFPTSYAAEWIRSAAGRVGAVAVA